MPVGVVRVGGDGTRRVGLLEQVAAAVVRHVGDCAVGRSGVAVGVGAAGDLVVLVVGGGPGARGVAAGGVGHRLGGDVAVVVEDRGGNRGVDRAGDPVGDRRVDLLENLAHGVVDIAGGEAGRVAVGDDRLGERTALPVVAVGRLQSGRHGGGGDVAVVQIGDRADRAARRGDLDRQARRHVAGVGGRISGTAVAERGRGGAAGREAGHGRTGGARPVAGRVEGVRGQVRVVGRGGRAAVTDREQHVVARVGGGEFGRGVVGPVGEVLGGAGARRLVLAGGGGDGVAADVVAGGGDVAVGVRGGVQEPAGVVAVGGLVPAAVDLGDPAVAGGGVVLVGEGLAAGLGDRHRLHRGQAGGVLGGLVVRGGVGGGQFGAVEGDIGDRAGEVAEVVGRSVRPAVALAGADVDVVGLRGRPGAVRGAGQGAVEVHGLRRGRG